MRDDNKNSIAIEVASRPAHWLYTTPDKGNLERECERLQRTIKVLIAIGFVPEVKAEQAYEIARKP